MPQQSSLPERPAPLLQTFRLSPRTLGGPGGRLLGGDLPRGPHLRLEAFAANLLDAVIVANTVAVLAVILFGGFDIGIWSASAAAKPALILILTVPVRRAIPCETSLGSRAAAAWRSLKGLRPSGVPSSVRETVPIAAVVTVATSAIGFAANLLVTPARPEAFPIPVRWQQFFEPFVVWDGGWYFTIASTGYDYVPGAQSTIAFFPLYPLLVRAVAWPLGSTPEAVLAAGIAVSCASLTAALIVLHRLTVQLTGSAEAARRTVLYLAVFPFSFYFTRLYTESLFLLLTVGATALAFRSRWLAAGVVGALAAATRPNGIVIALPLVILACADRPPAALLVRRFGALALVSLGPLAYSAYVFGLSGDPLMWLRVQEHWGYTLWHAPTQHLVTVATRVEEMGLYTYLVRGADAPYELLYAIVALAALALAPRVATVCGGALAAYVVVSVLIPLSGNTLVGMGRYVAVLFPLFIVLGAHPSRRVHEVLLVTSSVLLALLLVLFVRWYPLF